jgi:O-6-methylguanine DNA methyltransferase
MKAAEKAEGNLCLSISTSDGDFLARYSERGLCALDFPNGIARLNGEGKLCVRDQLGRERARFRGKSLGKSGDEDVPPLRISPQVRQWHATTARAVRLVLSGRAPGELPPLDLTSGTAFQQRVWQALLEIPSGETRSYAQVARAIGQPAATRAVGSACGANPIPVLVPCHRVLAANHKLGGFSAGVDWKRLLLGREKSWSDPLFS